MKTTSHRKKRLRDRPRFRNGLSVIPSLFTIGNMFCGYYAIASTLQANYDYAAIAIGVGAVLDTLDGRIARLTGTASQFGLELDSLADVLTFGVAPAVLALNWGIASLAGIPAEFAQDVYQFGWLATFGFLICGALRLARFNVLADKPGDSSRHFVGLPIPAAAGVIASIVHFTRTPIQQVGPALLWCFLVALLAFLMISRVRYPSFKDKTLPRGALVATAMLIGLIFFYSGIVLLLMASAYLASGPVSRIAQAVRRLMSKQPQDETGEPPPPTPGDLS
jgi:CDP-diacylglycerol--serine O-phosphatidyltransferase